MNITFEQIIDSISGVCLSHRQVNEWGYGDFLKQAKSNSWNYPITFLTDGKSKIVGTRVELNFVLIVADKLLHDNSNEKSVLSKCLEIGIDIIGKLQYEGGNDYYLNYESVIMSPFIDSFQDYLGGWKFELVINCSESYNSCDAPWKN